MIRFYKNVSAAFLLLTSIVLAQGSESIDARLVGAWEGSRITETACDSYIWRVDRSDDGKYVVDFFADPEMTDRITREEGTWWSKDGVFYEQSAAQKNSLNAFRYRSKGADEIYFEYIAQENV
ncbi:MAG: hypothetical protein ACR2P1_14220, partial [Pseudomonadales bacterium]